MSVTADQAKAKLTQRELAALRAELRRELAAETKPARQPRVRETPELAGAARRMVKAVGQRASADLDSLPLLVALQGAVDAELRAAVAAVRDPELTNGTPWSWADVGRVLGCTRQAAQQRFGGTL